MFSNSSMKFFLILACGCGDLLQRLYQRLMVIYCDSRLSIVCHQQLLQMTSNKLLAEF